MNSESKYPLMAAKLERAQAEAARVYDAVVQLNEVLKAAYREGVPIQISAIQTEDYVMTDFGTQEPTKTVVALQVVALLPLGRPGIGGV